MKEKEYLIAFRWTRYNLNVGWGRMVKRCNMSGANLNNVEDEMLSYINDEAEKIVAEGGETLTDNERFMMIKIMHFSELESDGEGV